MSQDYLELSYQMMKQLKVESLVDDSLNKHFEAEDEANWNNATQDEYLALFPDEKNIYFDEYITLPQKHYYKDVEGGKDIICFNEDGCDGVIPTYEQWCLFGDRAFTPKPNYDVELSIFKATDESYAQYETNINIQLDSEIVVTTEAGNTFAGNTAARSAMSDFLLNSVEDVAINGDVYELDEVREAYELATIESLHIIDGTPTTSGVGLMVSKPRGVVYTPTNLGRTLSRTEIENALMASNVTLPVSKVSFDLSDGNRMFNVTYYPAINEYLYYELSLAN